MSDIMPNRRLFVALIVSLFGLVCLPAGCTADPADAPPPPTELSTNTDSDVANSAPPEAETPKDETPQPDAVETPADSPDSESKPPVAEPPKPEEAGTSEADHSVPADAAPQTAAPETADPEKADPMPEPPASETLVPESPVPESLVPADDAPQYPPPADDQPDSQPEPPSHEMPGPEFPDARDEVPFSPSGPASEAPQTSSGPKKLQFNFRFQPWSEVLEWLAEEAGYSMILDTAPPGTFNYTDRRLYTPAEALDLLNGVLLTKGYTLVLHDRMLMVVNLEDEIPPALVTRIPVEELDKRGEYELLSTRFQLRGITSEQGRREIEGLLGPQGKIVELPQARQLIVTETGGRLREIRDVLDRAQATGDPAQSGTEVV